MPHSLAGQYAILDREKWQRILLTAFACVLCGLTAMRSHHGLHQISKERASAARASDAAQSPLLEPMRHELRPPLNAIIGLGEVEPALASGLSQD